MQLLRNAFNGRLRDGRAFFGHSLVLLLWILVVLVWVLIGHLLHYLHESFVLSLYFLHLELQDVSRLFQIVHLVLLIKDLKVSLPQPPGSDWSCASESILKPVFPLAVLAARWFSPYHWSGTAAICLFFAAKAPKTDSKRSGFSLIVSFLVL